MPTWYLRKENQSRELIRRCEKQEKRCTLTYKISYKCLNWAVYPIRLGEILSSRAVEWEGVESPVVRLRSTQNLLHVHLKIVSFVTIAMERPLKL